MGRIARGLMLAVGLGVASGCVSKAWRQRPELDRRDARLDRTLASVQGSTTQAQQDADLAQQRLQAVDQRIRELEARTADLDARTADLEVRAQGIWARADGAGSPAEGVGARVTRQSSTRNARTVVNTLPVEFGFNQASLDDSAKSMLFALVRELRDNPELALDLEGYTDSKGSRQYNIRLSQRRVDAVRAYLIEQGVERHRITWGVDVPLEDPKSAGEKVSTRHRSLELKRPFTSVHTRLVRLDKVPRLLPILGGDLRPAGSCASAMTPCLEEPSDGRSLPLGGRSRTPRTPP